VADLSLTALYTSAVWANARLPCAELCATKEAERVFAVTNAALTLVRKPPLRFALLHRHAMIDHLVSDSRAARVIELGAGLSPRGAAITRSEALTYIEIDLPSMIAKKRELLARSEAGCAALERVTLVAGDVTTFDLAAWVAREPTLVIAEGLFMYLTREVRRALFVKVAALAAECGDLQLVFDLVPADEEASAGFSGRLLATLMARATGGARFTRDARTRSEIIAELLAAGFSDAHAIGSGDVARAWQLPHPEHVTNTVVFTACARGTPT
jgi:O-methyltransferase involved in polyketide biosynthesis